MTVSKKVKAPASFIFGKLVESSLYDIKKQTGKSIRKENLKGFRYNKTFSTKQKAKMVIVDVVENELYSFQTSTQLREFITTWTLVDLGEEKCEIICNEEQLSHGGLQQANDFIMGLLLGWQKRRQLKAMMQGMADSYREA